MELARPAPLAFAAALQASIAGRLNIPILIDQDVRMNSMKYDMNDFCSAAKIQDMNPREVASVSAGAAPTQYLSGVANATNGTGGAITNGIARFINLAKNGCGYLASAT